MTDEEIFFIKGIPLKTLDDIRYDIIPIEAYIKATERKERRIEKLEKENAELKAQIEKMCCKNIYLVSDKNSNAVPCYTFYNCRKCTRKEKAE